ncbi:hypothetical protein HK098_001959 [Nowakowskiella sp. JEL0407]|nr:hypothetical protein HK098_001959 [Nowakowskiella sp. JEL0407]
MEQVPPHPPFLADRVDPLVKRYMPLITGLFLPIATFLNIQCISVPGWLYTDDNSENLFNLSPITIQNSESLEYLSSSGRTYIRPSFVFWLSSISLVFGLLGTGALFIRMLEKKIKWATRLMTIGAFGQGVVSILLVTIFSFLLSLDIDDPENPDLKNYHHTEGVFYSLVCGILSLFVAAVKQYEHYLNQNQLYPYTMYSLSHSQRQLILVFIVSISYTVIGGIVYGVMEDWDFDDALYWGVVTLTSIGFGDLAPKTVMGKVILPIYSSAGLFLIGSTIVSIRQVTLELLTLQLANQYEKVFGESFAQQLEVVRPSRQQQRSIVKSESDDLLREHRQMLHNLESVQVDKPSPKVLRKVPSVAKVGTDTDSAPPSPNRTPKLYRSRSYEEGMLEHAEKILQSRSVSSRSQPQPTSTASHHPKRKNKMQRSLSTTNIPLTAHDASSSMVISRADFLPQLRITGAKTESDRQQIVDTTRRILRIQIRSAFAVAVLNLIVFGGIFARMERWSYLEGVYFSFVSLSTIGYGDYTPKSPFSKAIFIWHIFIGIASMTFLGSLIAEHVLDRWVVEISRINNRVDRYEKKARIKKVYGKEKEWDERILKKRKRKPQQDQREVISMFENGSFQPSPPSHHVPSRLSGEIKRKDKSPVRETPILSRPENDLLQPQHWDDKRVSFFDTGIATSDNKHIVDVFPNEAADANQHVESTGIDIHRSTPTNRPGRDLHIAIASSSRSYSESDNDEGMPTDHSEYSSDDENVRYHQPMLRNRHSMRILGTSADSTRRMSAIFGSNNSRGKYIDIGEGNSVEDHDFTSDGSLTPRRDSTPPDIAYNPFSS